MSDYEYNFINSILAKNDILSETIIKSEYLKTHNQYFSLIKELYEKGIEINDIIITDLWKNKYEEQPPIGYISSFHPTTDANWKYYETQIINDWTKRKLKQLPFIINDGLKEKSGDEVLNIINNFMMEFQKDNLNGMVNMKDVLYDILDEMEKVARGEVILDGLQTGYDCIDSLIGGFSPGELIIIGARPSLGKSSLALNIAQNMIKNNISVGFFSCEMSSKQLVKRLIAAESRIGFEKLRKGTMRKSDYDLLTDAVNKIAKYSLIFDDTPNIRLGQLLSKARIMKKKGIQILFIDYITLITHESKTISKVERVGEISKTFKNLARELNIPVVALSQVNRDTEGKEPTLSALRWSGEIEQDSDNVIFLHRDREEENTLVIVAKARNAETGRGELIFKKEYVRFENKKYE